MFDRLQDYPGLGFGDSIADNHFIATAGAGGCAGAWFIDLGIAGGNIQEAGVSLNCGGQTGGLQTGFTFAIQGTQYPGCVLYNRNDGTNAFDIICASSQAAATSCGNAQIAANAAAFPLAALSLPTFTFVP